VSEVVRPSQLDLHCEGILLVSMGLAWRANKLENSSGVASTNSLGDVSNISGGG
jgi:hypothetical protein